jgi:hypothetical protein
MNTEMTQTKDFSLVEETVSNTAREPHQRMKSRPGEFASAAKADRPGSPAALTATAPPRGRRDDGLHAIIDQLIKELEGR